MLLRRVIGEFELELIFLDEPKFPRPVTPNVSKTSSAECLTHSKWAYKNTNHHDHNLTKSFTSTHTSSRSQRKTAASCRGAINET